MIKIFYTHVRKTTIIYSYNHKGTVPVIQNETEFFVILGHFFALYPPPTPLIFKKMKKASGNVIILNLCNKKNTIL